MRPVTPHLVPIIGFLYLIISTSSCLNAYHFQRRALYAPGLKATGSAADLGHMGGETSAGVKQLTAADDQIELARLGGAGSDRSQAPRAGGPRQPLGPHDESEHGLDSISATKHDLQPQKPPSQTLLEAFDRSGRRWQGPRFEKKMEGSNPSNRFKTRWPSDKKEFIAAMKQLPKNSKDHLASKWKKVLAQQKKAFPRLPWNKSRKVPELPIGPAAQVAPGPRYIPGTEIFEIHVTTGRRPPTAQEKTYFDKSKENIARGFGDTKFGYNLGNGKQFNMKYFSQLLAEKIPPKIGTVEREDQLRNRYMSYLRALSKYTENFDALNKANKALKGLERIQENPNVAKARNDINKAYELLDRDKLKNLKLEHKAAIKSLQKTNLKLKESLDSYFPDFVNKRLPASEMKKFIEARAIQITRKTPGERVDPIFLTAEQVLKTLPADFDLATQLYRYYLIQGFERILDEVRPEAKNFLEMKAYAHMDYVFQDNSHLSPKLENYIQNLGEDDFKDLIGKNPSEVFQQLTQPAQPGQKVAHAFGKAEQFLNDNDLHALEAYKGDPLAFKDKLRAIIRDNHKSNEPEKSNYLEGLRKLEREASNPNQINYPYVEELFQKRLIDEPTRNKLILASGMGQHGFLKALGTQENFTRGLMSNLKKDILQRVTTPNFKTPGGLYIQEEAPRILAELYLEKLDNQAKSFYLTRDSFQKPNSMEFYQALKFYEPQYFQKMFSEPDNEAVAKAFVGAHYDPPVSQAPVYKSQIDKLLSEIKGVPSTLSPEVTIKHLPPIDRRLALLDRQPLEADDPRLKGTPWEAISDADRAIVNTAARTIFPSFKNLERQSEMHATLEARMRGLEQELYEDIPGMVQVIKEIQNHAFPELVQYRPSLSNIPLHTINEAYYARVAKNKAPDKKNAETSVQ